MRKLIAAVNGALAPLNIAVTRRTTLDNTRAQLLAAQSQLESVRAEVAASSDELAQLRQLVIDRPSKTDGEALSIGIAPLRRDLDSLRLELLRFQIANRWSVIDAMERARTGTPAYRTCQLCNFVGASAAFKCIESNCIFGGGVLFRHQCPSCDVIFGADKMFDLSAGELSQDYEWHYKVYEEGDSTEAELRAFHSLNPSRNGIYVNYGAGSWSRTVPILREQGWNVLAYEPHASAASAADWLISNEQQMQGRNFDGIFSNNVLEHFRHPINELRKMKTWMKPGARMAHATPCFEYLYEYTRFHLFFFPGRSRKVLAERSELSISQFEVDGEFMNCVFSTTLG
ncbi:hypothetical protein BTH42_09555 [Burkholderia sp. SRS-W-2-2016]|uniref:methyltransferase domain-containing protein n=1 Tax=Burkholderia sp. SRS-W-2-2016 TaxID=1926878 RepID=UPI00094AF032|nr:methyltransferase domain-containing protein [Burkholderia sp. SRS-W-2-2016]OLL31871.1 hypothetical protein BTH42_09555 [Burkholderia sp. SRS-W-2-2016]